MKAISLRTFVYASALLLMGSAAYAGDEFVAGYVGLNSSHVNADGNLWAFVPTGSSSGVCLATPNDSNGYGVGPSPVICIPRDFQGKKGVVLSMIPYFGPFLSDLVLWITVYQRGAKFYGTPVLYSGP